MQIDQAMIRILLAGALLFILTPCAFGQGAETPRENLAEESVRLLVQYLKIDTSNPPGEEIRAARFLGEIFAREGIEYRLLESAPGRGNIWARLPGDGSKRPVILLNHLDVVPAYPQFWTHPPFGGLERDGFIYGRGALDMKSLAIAQLMVMLRLKRERIPLARDLIFIGTADEEAGGRLGAEWLVSRHPELLGGAEYLFNEGGGNLVQADGRVLAIGLSAVEKTPAWLRLTATGPPGHSSVPRPDSAVNRLVRALDRLIGYAPPLKVTTPVEQYFQSLAPLLSPAEARRYERLRQTIDDPDFRLLLDADPGAKALFQNTIAVTMLEGSNKVNVIPPIATALIDTRILPGERIEPWVRELTTVVQDERITIEPILTFEAVASPLDTEVAESLRGLVRRRFPDAVVTYPVTVGFTDSHYFRRRGINCYGFSPFVGYPQSLGARPLGARPLGDGYHGNDERIGRAVFIDGVDLLFDLLAPLLRRP